MKNQQRFLVPLLVVMSLMFIWNLSRNFNDVLIPHLKRACQLSDFQSSLIQSAFFGGYFLLAIPVGVFIKRFGYKAGMITGLLIAALGALLFLPAATLRYYPIFLTALFVMAAGFTFLEVTATPYISVLGDPEKAPSRLSLATAVGSLGATMGPYIAASALLHTTDISQETIAKFSVIEFENYLQSEAQLVKIPYMSLGILFILLSGILYLIKLPSIQEDNKNKNRFSAIFKYKHTVLGALGVFCYLGAEVGIVSFLIRYAKSLHIEGLGEQRSALFITLFMGLVLLGRLSGAYFLQKIKASNILMACAFGAALLACLSMLTNGYFSIYCLSFIGICTSVMYPVIFTLSIKNLGDFTKTGSSLLIMSIVGGAIIPPLMGLISDSISIKAAFILPVICYGYIFYYGKVGHKTFN